MKIGHPSGGRPRGSTLCDQGEHERAVAFVDACVVGPGYDANLTQLQAGHYTDCGLHLGRAELVETAISLWAGLAPETNPGIAYNLANAELDLYQLTVRKSGPADGWLTAKDHLHSARGHMDRMGADLNAPPELRLKALTNAGNAFDIVGRYVDALQRYNEALVIDPGFGMALGNRGIALSHFASFAGSHGGSVNLRAVGDLEAALARRESVAEFGGEVAVDAFADARGRYSAGPPRPIRARPREWQDPYLGWCARHDLFLHLHDCIDEETELLDALLFKNVVTELGDPGTKRMRHVVDGFNSIKQDYVAARYSTWLATSSDSHVRDHAEDVSGRASFLDSLGYARWGVRTGMTTQAFAVITNVLDKVASFVHLYLGSKRLPHRVHFVNFWESQDRKNMDATVRMALTSPETNVGLLALVDLSFEAARAGSNLAQRWRHAATHRFLVAHTMNCPASDDWIDRVAWHDLVAATIGQLHTARAAMIYLARLIHVHERAAADQRAAREPRKIVPAMILPRAEPRLMERD